MINTNEIPQRGWFGIIKNMNHEMKSIAHSFARFLMQVVTITGGLLALPAVISLNLLTKLACRIFHIGQ